MRVEIVKNSEVGELEKEINNILKNINSNDFIDIKFNSFRSGNYTIMHTAMIVLK